MFATRLSICTLIAVLFGSIGVAAQNPPSPTAPASPRSAPATPSTAPATTSPAPASAQNVPFSPADQKFMKDAAESGIAEVQLGQLAAQRATSDAVKTFGQRMVNDHGQANDSLKQIAAGSGIELPQQISPGDQAIKDQLSQMSGEAFDNYYMDLMLKNHDDDVPSFYRQSQDGTNAKLKEFAKTTLPVLEDHLSQVRNIIKAENSTTRPDASPME